MLAGVSPLHADTKPNGTIIWIPSHASVVLCSSIFPTQSPEPALMALEEQWKQVSILKMLRKE